MRSSFLRLCIVWCSAASLVLAVPARPAHAAAPAPVVPQPAARWAAPHVPQQLLVKWADAGPQGAVLSRRGVRVIRAIPQLGLALVETPAGADLAVAAEALAAEDAVAWAEPNYTFALDFVPNDPAYGSIQSTYLGRLALPAAWDVTVGRPEIVIAILDTGLDTTHPDLAAGVWRNPGEIAANGLDDDGNGFVDDLHGWDFGGNSPVIYDDHGHGTHVAGIAAARINNGIGLAGMAGVATIMPVDVFGGGIGAYEDLIRAIVYATDNGAHVINMSLGASSYSLGEEAAVDYAWSHGVVVVAAAGNTGSEAVHYPAAHEHAIAVASTTAADALSGSSTRGTWVDIAAPGSSIYSTFPNNGYGYLGGTSMATPHVAGLAALILSRNPDLSPAEVEAIIEQSAEDLGEPGFDKLFGHGRINAGRALAQTPAGAGTVPPRGGPPLAEWPAGCTQLIADGGFEAGSGEWALSGAASVRGEQSYAGAQALQLAGGPAATAVVTRTFTLPAHPRDALLWFAFRIEDEDDGWGTAASWPYDDWLTAEFKDLQGQTLASLLRTGNTADTAASGLPWDRYSYRLQASAPVSTSGPVLFRLAQAGTVNLVFTAQGDADDLPTDFWIDAVQFCVTVDAHTRYLPLAYR